MGHQPQLQLARKEADRALELARAVFAIAALPVCRRE
jgi:hypothetical protein